MSSLLENAYKSGGDTEVGTSTSAIDFGGARGSNTGDQFHELWALQHVLDLLQPGTDLKAVGVEGVRTETEPQNAGSPTWEGVDCALYYGGLTLETADRIEFEQLKYSAAHPGTAWSVARLVARTAKKGNNSIIRRMADDFRDAKARLKPGAQLKIRLLSNQDVSLELREAINARWSGPLNDAGLNDPTLNDLNILKSATGLAETDFQEFLRALDFSECGSHSRFAVKEKVVGIVAGLLGDDVLSEVRELQINIRQLMMPESTGRVVTYQVILAWFGLSSSEGLFPCPLDIRIPDRSVKRPAADEVVKLIMGGKRLILVHGVGGCGKTTLMRQISDGLPEQSVTIFFDCFGGGRYMYPEDKRHLPQNAFLHLANELAVTLRLPLFIPRSGKYPANIQTFLGKVRSAGEALKQLTPQGILLIVVDAADNSVIAASNASPPEVAFVDELFEANLSDLPENVRIVTSCRTDPARRSKLHFPLDTPEIVCPPFTERETRQHLEGTFSDLNETLVKEFQKLSNGNPRVQGYAIAAAGGDQSKLLKALLPGGKDLTDILENSFDIALKKIGRQQLFENLVGALALLPPPISVASMARIASCTPEVVKDLALDLAPGLRLDDDNVTVADEDFEAFIKERGMKDRDSSIAAIAGDFFTTFHTDPYSSSHVADFLIDAGRASDLLSVVEKDPQATAIKDPILCRQTQVRRLRLSLAGCRQTGSRTDALKIVLISAEAERDDNSLNAVLEKELDLSVEFAGSSLRRKILLDRDRVQEHGSFLAQDAARAIRAGDPLTAREQLRFHDAWLNRRRDIPDDERRDWTVTARDISARVEAILNLAGPKAAMDELFRWRPHQVRLEVAYLLVPELIAAGKSYQVHALLDTCPPNSPWKLLMLLPLAMAGESVDGFAIEQSLKFISGRFIPEAGAFRMAYAEDAWPKKLLDTYISAFELAFKMGLDQQTILDAANRISEVLESKGQWPLYGTDEIRIDGLLRCWFVSHAISGNAAKCEDFIAYVKAFSSEPKPEERRGRIGKKGHNEAHRTDREVERLERKIQALFPIYSARIEILCQASTGEPITGAHLDRLGDIAPRVYGFDDDYEATRLRETVANSVMGLLIVHSIEPFELVSRANKVARGRFDDSFAHRRLNVWARARLRKSASENLVLNVAKAKEEIKRVHAASTEKLEAIIELSRLILPVSREDSRALFNDSIEIAKEIDQEAIDQIKFVSVLANRANIPQQQDRRAIAEDIFSFVSGAAERLSGYDGFPWTSAVQALACVDDRAALAAICRWADDGTVSLDDTLTPFLQTSLHRGVIGPEIATSLALLIGGAHGDLQRDLVSRAAVDIQNCGRVIEELAKEVLLFLPQNGRHPSGQDILERIPENEYTGDYWVKNLRATVAFWEALKADACAVQEISDSGRAIAVPQNDGAAKEFEFAPQDGAFTTPESIAEVLTAARISGLRYDNRSLLKKMVEASSNPRDRVPFLNAISELADDLIWRSERILLISSTIVAWKGTPAVDRWCKEKLPSILVSRFLDLSVEEARLNLHQLLDYTGCDADGRLRTILEGVAKFGESLSSRSLFGIAEEVANELNPEETGEQLPWYARRLRSRLPADEQSRIFISEIPTDTTEAIARFLFALMSDIDTRIRWKAAHALRCLARLDCFDIVRATVREWNRLKDAVFRDPTEPFYFLAARLWLMIATYRISVESPEALRYCKEKILAGATSEDLPHVAIREYAKRALLELVSTKVVSLNDSERDLVQCINTPLMGENTIKDTRRHSSRTPDPECRFEFDTLDTIPYWYNRILDFFPTVSQHRVLEMADRWIIDQWGADPEARLWKKEPRNARFDERRFGLWSNDHGSFPVIERYGTHLEWNAMYCLVGELLKTEPILKAGEDDFDSFYHWLRYILPTEPPGWVSDNRGPTPLEPRLWIRDKRTDVGWLHNIRQSEFLAEIGSASRPGWVVVEGYYTAYSPKREATARISSALISPETAAALVRALQTASDPFDFRIPNEGNDLEIDASPFRLVGWLAYGEGDVQFDDHDPFRYEVDQVRCKPGRRASEVLELVPKAGTYRTWVCRATGQDAFVYEAWCDELSPERDYDDYDGGHIRSDGWRLWARSDLLRSFITEEGWDLICEVQIKRGLRNPHERSYEADTKRKTHEKILLMQADGSVADAKGRVGSWTRTGE